MLTRRAFLVALVLGGPLVIRRWLTSTTGAGTTFPSRYNDEFDDASTLTTRWTFTGVGGVIHKDINTTVPGCAYLQAYLLQPAPSPPYTIYANCIAIDWDAGPAVGNSSIALAQAAPGPNDTMGVDVGFVGQMDLTSSLFDSSGAFVHNDPNLPTGNAVSGYGYAVPHVLRAVVHSATNIDLYISFDAGVTWTTIFTGKNLGLTPNYIGLANGGSRGSWDWFRVTQP